MRVYFLNYFGQGHIRENFSEKEQKTTKKQKTKKTDSASTESEL
jgi:hypothetical protein